MALRIEGVSHKAPEVPPFREAAGTWEPGGERGEVMEFVPAEDEAPRLPVSEAALRLGYEAVGAAAPPDSTPAGWNPIAEAPKNRPVYMTVDPEKDQDGTLAYWRTTREKHQGRKGWHPHSFWASVLTRRALDFEPLWWREPDTSAAA